MTEAVPVVEVAHCGNSNNFLEALALMNGGGGFGGNNIGIWFLFLLFSMGGNWGGNWGNRGALGADVLGNIATSTAKNEAGLDYIGQTVAGYKGTLDQIIAGQYQNTINLGNAICNLGYQNQQGFNQLGREIADCCCGIKTEILTGFNALGQAIAQTNYNNALTACSIKEAIHAEGEATRAMFAQSALQEARDALSDAKLKLALCESKKDGCQIC